jgi:hypothetical protein
LAFTSGSKLTPEEAMDGTVTYFREMFFVTMSLGQANILPLQPGGSI